MRFDEFVCTLCSTLAGEERRVPRGSEEEEGSSSTDRQGMERAEEDLNQCDVACKARRRGVNGSCGMLMGYSRALALCLQPKPITANSTAIY